MPRPVDANPNPYQSPRSYDREASGGDLLKAYGWESILAQGTLSRSEVFRTYFGVRGPKEHIVVSILVMWLFGLPIAAGSLFACVLGLRYGEVWRTVLGGWGLLLFGVITPVAIVLDAVAVLRVGRLGNTGRGIFAHQERVISDAGIDTISVDGRLHSPWSDYARYRRVRDTLVLQVRRRAFKRRQRDPSRPAASWSSADKRLLRLDIFPRSHFVDDAQWEAFRALVKAKVRTRF